jgi:hypothetical protein
VAVYICKCTEGKEYVVSGPCYTCDPINYYFHHVHGKTGRPARAVMLNPERVLVSGRNLMHT